jgi:hypothetical protein
MFMKTISRVLASLVLVATAGVASAQTAAKDFYVEGGLLGLNSKNDSNGYSATPKLARFVVGKEINQNLAVEGMVGLNLSKDNGSSGDTVGAFLKPKMEVSKDVEVFARIGAARTKLKADDGSSATISKGAYGLGAQVQFTKDVYGQVDYMHYGKKDGVTASGFNFSIGTRF